MDGENLLFRFMMHSMYAVEQSSIVLCTRVAHLALVVMKSLEQIIAEFRDHVRTDPKLRSMVELLVAIGQQLLNTPNPSDDEQSSLPLSYPTDANQEILEPSTNTEHYESPLAQTEPLEEGITQADLERLLKHFNGDRSPSSEPHSAHRMVQVPASSPTIDDDVRLQKPWEIDVELITARARLKAEVARWCADRLRAAIPPEEEAQYYRSVTRRAKVLPGCYLWMLKDHPTSDLLLEYIADCYCALADLVELLPKIPLIKPRPKWARQLLQLAATIQSALYHVLKQAGVDVDKNPDPDQIAVYQWLQWYTRTNRVYIQRHMRRQDPADYTHASEYIEQLDKLRQRIPTIPSTSHTQSSQQTDSAAASSVSLAFEAKKSLRTIAYHVGHILRRSADPEYHWRRIREEIENVIGMGLPPSNVELRTTLLPVIEYFPDDEMFLTQPVRLVLRDIDRYLSQLESSLQEAEHEPPIPSPELERVHTALQGKTVVLIGGDERPYTKRAIEDAFGCTLVWVATRPHESIDLFVPYVQRQEVAVVLLAIRWSSHSYAEVAHLCKQHAKPFVRLPGGYNPQQIALRIVEQASVALGLESSGGRT